MENKETRVRLEDVINYAPQEYITETEQAIIRSAFKDNDFLLNVIRKIFWPTIYDAQTPIEQFGNDGFNLGRDWAAIPADEAKILAVARQDALQFIMGGIMKLKTIANIPQESAEAAALRKGKDSTQ